MFLTPRQALSSHLCDFVMNFYPDQLFYHVAGAGDWTTSGLSYTYIWMCTLKILSWMDSMHYLVKCSIKRQNNDNWSFVIFILLFPFCWTIVFGLDTNSDCTSQWLDKKRLFLEKGPLTISKVGQKNHNFRVATTSIYNELNFS